MGTLGWNAGGHFKVRFQSIEILERVSDDDDDDDDDDERPGRREERPRNTVFLLHM